MEDDQRKFDLLPEDCVAYILSLTSPRDACHSSLVSSAIRAAAESDTLWRNFLPADYQEILTNLASQLPMFSSRKDLFLWLCTPILIDRGNKTFSLDKLTSKKCYMLSARELRITWANDPLQWSWKPHLRSRFGEVAELITTWWLEIVGSIQTRILSSNTTYGVYLVVKFANRTYGLDYVWPEVSIDVGNYRSRGTVNLNCLGKEKNSLEQLSMPNKEERVPSERKDGWLEIELGEVYISDGSDEEVGMSLREVKGAQLKGGLIVEGIELRPKN